VVAISDPLVSPTRAFVDQKATRQFHLRLADVYESGNRSSTTAVGTLADRSQEPLHQS
jgi:hypothetical protein